MLHRRLLLLLSPLLLSGCQPEYSTIVIENEGECFDVGGSARYDDVDRDGWGPEQGYACCTLDEAATAALEAKGQRVAEEDLCATGDGASAYSTKTGDCVDGDASISPDQPEICDPNDVDEDCTGLADDADPNVSNAGTWYPDADGDGHGAGTPTVSCDAPTGSVTDNTDCDDQSDQAHPGGTELCDGLDNDCDGQTDEDDAADAGTWYRDADEDGYGDGANPTYSCTQPAGHIGNPDDCDDRNNRVNLASEELCDGIDNDCDGQIDTSATDALAWYRDYDGDGFGDPASMQLACAVPTDHVDNDQDCDDQAAGNSPLGIEVCDGADNNCNGSVDENSAIDADTWYLDADGDGHGDLRSSTVACTAPAGYTASDDDCDDAVGTSYPGATELCNGADDDCDGTTDESDALDASTWYADSDADGYGDAGSFTASCTQPVGYVADDTDCDPLENTTWPGAPEYCNDSADSDCDGSTDPATGTWCLTASVAYYGQNDADYLGLSLVGDVDDDSSNDAILGLPGALTEIGAIYVDSGGQGSGTVAGLDYRVEGVQSPNGFPGAMVLLDIGGPALAVGAGNGWHGYYGGDVVVFLDPIAANTSVATASDALYFTGPSYAFHAGASLAAGEGSFGEFLLIGMPGEWNSATTNHPGSVHLVDLATALSGSAGSYSSPISMNDPASYGSYLLGEDPNDTAGQAVAVGDLNGDGFDDLAIGAPLADAAGPAAGRVYLIEATLNANVDLGSESDAILDGEATGNYAGYSLSIGDVDDDGSEDLVVGAPYADTAGADAGAVYVYRGGSWPSSGSLSGAWARFDGERPGDHAGDDVEASLLDSFAEPLLLIGAGRMDENGEAVGGAYVYHAGSLSAGTHSLSTAELRIVGTADGNRTGEAISGGDVDGDGGADLLIGALNESTNGPAAGAVYKVPSSAF